MPSFPLLQSIWCSWHQLQAILWAWTCISWCRSSSIQQSITMRYAALHTIKRNCTHDNNEYEFPSEQQQQQAAELRERIHWQIVASACIPVTPPLQYCTSCTRYRNSWLMQASGSVPRAHSDRSKADWMAGRRSVDDRRPSVLISTGRSQPIGGVHVTPAVMSERSAQKKTSDVVFPWDSLPVAWHYGSVAWPGAWHFDS